MGLAEEDGKFQESDEKKKKKSSKLTLQEKFLPVLQLKQSRAITTTMLECTVLLVA